MNRLEKLKEDFKNLKVKPIQIKLWISMPSGETELIINPNVIDKMIYIEKTYDEMLVHKGCPQIKISSYEFVCADDELTYSFGDALLLCKRGFRIARKNWNGKNMYVYFVPAASYPACTEIARAEFGDMVPYRAYLALKTNNNQVATWVPSISDLLENDWYVVS